MSRCSSRGLKWKSLKAGISTLQDLKRDFEQLEGKLASNIGLFSATERVALNLTIFVSSLSHRWNPYSTVL